MRGGEPHVRRAQAGAHWPSVFGVPPRRADNIQVAHAILTDIVTAAT